MKTNQELRELYDRLRSGLDGGGLAQGLTAADLDALERLVIEDTYHALQRDWRITAAVSSDLWDSIEDFLDHSRRSLNADNFFFYSRKLLRRTLLEAQLDALQIDHPWLRHDDDGGEAASHIGAATP